MIFLHVAMRLTLEGNIYCDWRDDTSKIICLTVIESLDIIRQILALCEKLTSVTGIDGLR
jgi:hypothetical protein